MLYFSKGALSLIAPFLFGPTIFIFALERGILSNLLRRRFFLWLGAWSYSIYMMHVPIAMKLFYSIGGAIQKLSGLTFFTSIDGKNVIGLGPWSGDAFTMLYLIIVLTASAITY